MPGPQRRGKRSPRSNPADERKKAISSFKAKLDKMPIRERRAYLLSLLLRFKVDHSQTPRTMSAGLTRYTDQQKCDSYSRSRTARPGMLGETYLWKPVGKEVEFTELLNNPAMPWKPRSSRAADEKKTVIGLFRHIFRTNREGLFVSIRDNRITHWIPFFKLKYTNPEIPRLDFSQAAKRRPPRGAEDSDWLIEGCEIIQKYKRTEHGVAQYYDLFVQTCRKGIADVDFFINFSHAPIIPSREDLGRKYGIMVLSPTTTDDHMDIVVPAPREWEGVNPGIFYPLSCKKDDATRDFVVDFKKKKPTAVYRDALSGCYPMYKSPTSKKWTYTDGNETARQELVKFLKRFRGAGLTAALQGDPRTAAKLRVTYDNKVREWPAVYHPETGMNEAEYDIQTWTSAKQTLLRSGTPKEQEEAMDIIAHGKGKWWPAGIVSSTGGNVGDLAGGPAYKKAVTLYWNLVRQRVYYEELKRKYEDSPTEKSPPYKPGSLFGGEKTDKINRAKAQIEKMEEELAAAIRAGEKERYYIHGKGGIKYPTRYARPPGGMIGKEGLEGMRKYWKKNKVGTREERNNILKRAKNNGIMFEKPLTIAEQSQSKFIVVYNDAQGMKDFYLKAQTGSVLLIFDDLPFRHWLLDRMQAGVHYFPVNKNTFERVFKWCLWYADSPRVKKIADNLAEFMAKNNTRDEMINHIQVSADVSNYLLSSPA